MVNRQPYSLVLEQHIYLHLSVLGLVNHYLVMSLLSFRTQSQFIIHYITSFFFDFLSFSSATHSARSASYLLCAQRHLSPYLLSPISASAPHSATSSRLIQHLGATHLLKSLPKTLICLADVIHRFRVVFGEIGQKLGTIDFVRKHLLATLLESGAA